MTASRPLAPIINEQYNADRRADHKKRPCDDESFYAHHSRKLPSDLRPKICKLAPIAVQVSPIASNFGNEIGNCDNP